MYSGFGIIRINLTEVRNKRNPPPQLPARAAFDPLPPRNIGRYAKYWSLRLARSQGIRKGKSSLLPELHGFSTGIVEKMPVRVSPSRGLRTSVTSLNSKAMLV